jgi:tRNA1(Val) A37 N6-methylase TrmN6
MLPEHRYVTIKETASILSVSRATVRNWIRHEYLRPLGGPGDIVFKSDEVYGLRDRISGGSISRLNRRSNKTVSRRCFIPDEYIDDPLFRKQIERIISCIRDNAIDPDAAVFILAVRLLMKEGITDVRDAAELIGSGFDLSRRRYLGRELAGWHAELGGLRMSDSFSALAGIDLPSQEDVLGLIYQSLLSEGDKSLNGSYYTPSRIVAEMARTASYGQRILDPCCGTGRFFLSFSDGTGDPEHLYGYDTDRTAVHIARINLMLKFGNRDFDPRVRRGNFFLDELQHDGIQPYFDLIATNPPWGLHNLKLMRSRLELLHPEIKSFESFSYILKKSIDLLAEGGRLSFLLPESILHVKVHADIRKYILENTRVERITHLGRIFTNVFSPVIRLDLKKGKKGSSFYFVNKNRRYQVDQNRFSGNRYHVFDIHIDDIDRRILDRIYGVRHTTLEGKADWALGIVTGDNGRYVSLEGDGGKHEPVYKGRDVDRYVFKEPSGYIMFSPGSFQQSAPESKYRAREKLVYRFISKSIVMAYDDRQRLTLNSANMLVPRVDGYPIKAVLALFNSMAYQYIFQKKYFSIKVLREHLEQLPLPLLDRGALRRMVMMADEIIQGGGSLEEMDDFIMDQFLLKTAERIHIRRSVGQER